MPSVISPHTTISPPQSNRRAKDPQQRRQHNRRQPLLQLCPDVLEYVFLLGASLQQDGRSLRRAIISYSQTCHDWRVVAFSVKRLWSQLIDFEGRSLDWNKAMLRRSHPMPVHVTFQVKKSRFQDTRKLLAQLEYLERFQSYSILCPDTSWEVLLAKLERPAPQLETLRILYHPNQILSNLNPVRLPKTLFDGRAPKLRRLEMTECIIDFNSPLLRNLTALHVTDLSLADAPTASEWLQYLTLMPGLTELSLEGAIASVWDRPPSIPSITDSLNYAHSDDDKALQLPWITDLQLDAGTEDVSAMLKALPMPTPCRWSFLCANARPGPALSSIITKFNYGLCNSYADGDPCPLSLAANSTNVYLVSQAQAVPTSTPPVIYLNLHCPDSSAMVVLFPAVMAELGDSIAKITALEVNVPSIHPSLISVLCRATRVETLVRLRGVMTSTLLPGIQEAAATPGSLMPLPALANIVFMDDNSMWRQNYQHFTEFIKWREGRGVPIRKVYFTDCWILEDKVREMRDLGVDVQGGQENVKWWNL